MTKPTAHLLSLNIKNDQRLENYTTFRLGGLSRGIIECQNQEELITAVKSLNHAQEKFILIGSGSNVVVSDKGIDAFVIRYMSPKPLIQRNKHFITVSASTILDDLSLYCIENALSGLVFTSGIPGTVGGAVVGNAGAFGEQVGDIIETVTILNQAGEVKKVSQDYLQFSYRDSFLKKSGDIVIDVTFKLSDGNRDELQAKRVEILNIRHEKHPDLNVYPCAGSFFRNIEPTSKAERRQAAGWFLEQAGGKNLFCGGAKIFEKHANIIVKDKHGTAQDVFNLHNEMKQIVKNKFNIDLVREVRFVGQFDQMPNDVTEIIW